MESAASQSESDMLADEFAHVAAEMCGEDLAGEFERVLHDARPARASSPPG
jgi:hypothetical protein